MFTFDYWCVDSLNRGAVQIKSILSLNLQLTDQLSLTKPVTDSWELTWSIPSFDFIAIKEVEW